MSQPIIIDVPHACREREGTPRAEMQCGRLLPDVPAVCDFRVAGVPVVVRRPACVYYRDAGCRIRGAADVLANTLGVTVIHERGLSRPVQFIAGLLKVRLEEAMAVERDAEWAALISHGHHSRYLCFELYMAELAKVLPARVRCFVCDKSFWDAKYSELGEWGEVRLIGYGRGDPERLTLCGVRRGVDCFNRFRERIRKCRREAARERMIARRCQRLLRPTQRAISSADLEALKSLKEEFDRAANSPD